MTDLQGQVAFITGGSSGIGKATAKRLAEAGMKVAICARRADKLERALAELRLITPHSIARPVDITDSAAVRAFVGEIEDTLGPIDVLVNNAGIYRFNSVLDTSTEEWDLQFNINLKGQFIVSKAVIPGMVQRKTGRVIFISSTIALISPENNACYTACRRGLEGFAGSIARELMEHNINVHVLRPGFTDTDAYNEIGGKPDWEIDWIAPEEIASTIEFLCKLPKHAQIPELSYMTSYQRKTH